MCAATTLAHVASGIVRQSQSMEKLPTRVLRQLRMMKFAPEPSWSQEGSMGRRGGRRKTSVAPQPSKVKSVKPSIITPRGALKS